MWVETMPTFAKENFFTLVGDYNRAIVIRWVTMFYLLVTLSVILFFGAVWREYAFTKKARMKVYIAKRDLFQQWKRCESWLGWERDPSACMRAHTRPISCYISGHQPFRRSSRCR